jgi:RHS repeat-associated protein
MPHGHPRPPHHYPFGLTMAGISYKALAQTTSNLKFLNSEFQNNEFQDGTGLDQYELGARFYNQQIGRFQSIDPLADYMRRWSPYVYGFDSPIRFADGNGMSPGDSTKKDDNSEGLAKAKTLKTVVVTGHKNNNGFLNMIWRGVATVAENAPFVGSGLEIYKGARDGNWKQAGFGIFMLGLDVFTAGEGGELIRLGKNVGEYAIEKEVKEIAEKEFIEQTEKRTFDEAREEAFRKAGIGEGEFDMAKASEKADPLTGTLTEFKGEGGAKVGYDGPHNTPGPHHDTQHISWQSAGKRGSGGAARGNIPYEGATHPSRPTRK